MNLNINKEILEKFSSKDIKVYFFGSGCEWTKINLTIDFDKTWLEFIEIDWKNIYFEAKDKSNLDLWKIVLKPKTDNIHSKDDEKYIFLSEKIKSRCGCSTSFSFENKLIDKNKLSKLKAVFKK